MSSPGSLEEKLLGRSPGDERDVSFAYLAMDNPLSSQGAASLPFQSEYREVVERGKKPGLFSVGRDFRAAGTVHLFTPSEMEKMHNFESIQYHEPISNLFKHAVEKIQPENVSFPTKWFVMLFIGLFVGLISALMTNSIKWLSNVQWEILQFFLHDSTDKQWSELRTLLSAYAGYIGLDLGLVLVGSAVVVFLQPLAAGSGIPEVMGYLNGVELPKVFTFKTMAVKFISCVCAVGSHLPVGPEGPMIHIGAMAGALVAQIKTVRRSYLRVVGKPFYKFCNHTDHYDFIAAGAGAGVSAAFSAPIGGLLFVMEEIASWWDTSLTLMIFLTAMSSAFTQEIFDSFWEGWERIVDEDGHLQPFGQLRKGVEVLFEYDAYIPVNILEIIPAILLGFLGGGLGIFFTWFNLKMARFRGRRINVSKFRKILEVCAIVIVFDSICFWLPFLFTCQPLNVEPKYLPGGGKNSLVTSVCNHTISTHGTAPPSPNPAGGIQIGTMYSPIGTLTLNHGEGLVRILLAPKTEGLFPAWVLVLYLMVYFLAACYTAGCSLSSGLVIPMLAIGALMGRSIGLWWYTMFESWGMNTDWIDTGKFAVVGAGAFFAGVSRLTISLTVIMLEISSSVHHLLPMMVAVLTAKWVADFRSHPLYHALLEVKCVPFLDNEPVIPQLHLFTAKDVMSPSIVTLPRQVSVRNIIQVLQNTTHNAFPVTVDDTSILMGLISRTHLYAILEQEPHLMDGSVTNNSLLFNKMKGTLANRFLTRKEFAPTLSEAVRHTVIDLSQYMDTSPWAVTENFSLQFTYQLFRTMGLRHIVVLDGHSVVGMITRKDLLGQHMQEKLKHVPRDIPTPINTTRSHYSGPISINQDIRQRNTSLGSHSSSSVGGEPLHQNANSTYHTFAPAPTVNYSVVGVPPGTASTVAAAAAVGIRLTDPINEHYSDSIPLVGSFDRTKSIQLTDMEAVQAFAAAMQPAVDDTNIAATPNVIPLSPPSI